jgi:energy-coupling factor transporter transmembrane protein EcfT
VKRLSIPLLAGALRRVQTTAVAMDARGFGAYATRTELDELSRPWTGPALVLGHGLLLAAVIALRLFSGDGFQAIRAPIGGG